MWFAVSVPVLSVQMTVVDPSASTALNRFTTAPRRASERTPAASARVIVGSSPSGTLATSSPTANTHASGRPSPASMPSGRKARADHDGDRRDQPGDRAHLPLQRAGLPHAAAD